MSLAATASAQAGQPTSWAADPEMHAQWKAWRETMKKHPLPKKKGCFTASYPATEWSETTCAPPPKTHTSPAKNAVPETVGYGNDYTAGVSGAPLSSVTGSFPIVSGYTGVNAYSLQINTNTFPTSACNGAADPSACSGWVQFIFNESSGQLYLEYSLINWGSTNCPAAFPYNYTPGGGEVVCYVNTPGVRVLGQSLVDLPYLELTGNVSGATNTAILSTPDGNIYATVQDGLLGTDLANAWNNAEFNVVGNDDANEAYFNSGTTFVVQTSVNNGTTNTPACMSGGTTAETNNLNLIGPCCSYGGASPNIQFMESNDSNASATCGTGGLLTNFIAPTPSNSSSYTTYGGEYPTITFTETLYDSTPGAVIYWQVSGCSGSTSGGSPVSSGGSFTLTYQSQYNCNPSGTMYAAAPGYAPSPTVPISF